MKFDSLLTKTGGLGMTVTGLATLYSASKPLLEFLVQKDRVEVQDLCVAGLTYIGFRVFKGVYDVGVNIKNNALDIRLK